MAEKRSTPALDSEGIPASAGSGYRGLAGGTESYEIRVRCHLSDRWSEWFEGLAVTNLENGEALLRGPLPDQAALLGVLERLSDLNVPLVSVNPYEGGQSAQAVVRN